MITSIYRHNKRGTMYQILHIGFLEKDLSEQVVYQDIVTKKIWIRPSSEFFDGRFKEIKGVCNKIVD